MRHHCVLGHHILKNADDNANKLLSALSGQQHVVCSLAGQTGLLKSRSNNHHLFTASHRADSTHSGGEPVDKPAPRHTGIGSFG
jgi:nitrate reductase gamma subunit